MTAAQLARTIARGPFQPTWESLVQNYRVPEWFRDAKFGIWAHWSAQCVPEQGDWYARRMYQQGDSAYDHHVKTYGHPSKFGFMEIDNLWKAERWQPEKLMALYLHPLVLEESYCIGREALTYGGDAQAVRALKAGASGYLLKNMLRKELVETNRSVHAGKRRIPPEIAVEIAEHHADDALTEREIEVLRDVAAGNANKMIAAHLAISEETVKAHMRSILSKLGANDRTHAVTIALKRGIIDI